MVKKFCKNKGLLIVECVIAIGVLAIAISILTPAFCYEQITCRDYYCRSIAMEIVDGEMEVLMAGEWKVYGEGQHRYTVTAQSAQNLPEGEFILTIQKKHVRLEWKPLVARRVLYVVREGECR
jgi:hypothetical protein